ncbi:ABC transporter permease subunit [Pyrococcus kukulkanii]|uniref:ABC transporter permease subunit n=1 Tax=Pyrococcus kukulkanii TaxID=1609559 RepID=UPI0035648FF6
MKGKIGMVLILCFVIFALLANFTVSREDLDNWNNANYWVNNPKLAYPTWLCPLYKKTPTIEAEVFNGTFVYEHRFRDRPNDILFYIHDGTRIVEIKVIRPDGRIVIFKGKVRNNVISLNSDMREAIISQLHIPIEKAMLKSSTFLLFSKIPDLDVLNGRYIFIVSGAEKVKVLGNCYGFLGTDRFGRDMWVGFILGMNNTLILTALVVGLTLLLGITVGIASMYSEIINWMLEVLTALPVFPFLLILTWLIATQGVGYNVRVSTLEFSVIFSLLTFGKFAKTVRMISLKERAMEYVRASIAIGGGETWVLKKHIMPKILEFSIRHVTFLVPRTIALISIFGFFGLSPGINWGTYIIEAMNEGALYGGYWWWIIAPIIAMGVISLGFATLSEELPKS